MELLTAFTSFAPLRMMPLCSASRPTMNPVTSWKKMIGTPVWLQSMMKRAALSALSAIDDAAHLDAFLLRAHLQPLARDNPDRSTADARVSRDERLAVVGLVFIDRIGVDDRKRAGRARRSLVAIEADQIRKPRPDFLPAACRLSLAILGVLRFRQDARPTSAVVSNRTDHPFRRNRPCR